MRRSTCLCLLVLSLMPLAAGAQSSEQPLPQASSPAPPGAAPFLEAQPLIQAGTSEWMISGGNAWGVEVFHSAPGHRYAVNTFSWGRILTQAAGPGWLRGHFEWALELMPVYGQYEPEVTYGFGFTPLVWRWNFQPLGRFAPYAELAGGGLWTTNPVPERTTTINYTAHAGVGLRVLIRPQQALVFGYRFHHISNGNRVDRNPGVNANTLQVGWSLLQPRR